MFTVPEYPAITNYGQKPDTLLASIDTIEKDREWRKVPLLLGDASYHAFLSKTLGASDEDLASYCRDFAEDKQFYEAFAPNLAELEQLPDAGDLRLNSLVPYLAARVLKPKTIIETGVAAGKSSALFLLGLQHNGDGALISIDLPNDGGTMQDGAQTTTGQRPAGWLVPDYLRSRWTLMLEDSKAALPRAIAKAGSVDLFMHDSLHTYEHAGFEFAAASSAMISGGMVMCDNLEGEAGRAFSDFLIARKMVGYAYRNFGCARLESNHA